MVVSNDSSDT